MTKFYINSPKYGKIECLIDDIDAWILNYYTVRILKGKSGHTDYVRCRYKGKEPTILLHKLIAPAGFIVDHINGNGLDNRRCNLRAADYIINNGNAKIRKDNTTGVKGVSFKNGLYYARLQYKKVRHNLGAFTTLAAAQCAYNLKYKELHGRGPRE